MKNKQTNVLKGSLLAIAFAAIIGFSFAACDYENTGSGLLKTVRTMVSDFTVTAHS